MDVKLHVPCGGGVHYTPSALHTPAGGYFILGQFPPTCLLPATQCQEQASTRYMKPASFRTNSGKRYEQP